MKIHFPLIALLLSLFQSYGQNRYSFTQETNVKVYHGSDTLKNAWGGGINYPNVSSMELNFDGRPDLLLFDRSGYRVLPFLSLQINGEDVYRYAPQFIDAFPAEKTRGSFLLMRDFNCDGKKDIFYSDGNFILVYENTSQNGTLSFSPANNGDPLKSTYSGGAFTELYIARTDLPDINDVDGDGDLDILTFGNNGTTIEFHENLSTGCGLDFVETSDCWGDFVESGIYRTVEIDGCSNPGKKGFGKVQHSGSAMVTLDLDNNSIPDLLLTNVSYNNMSALINGGTLDTADIISQDTLYPPSNPVDLYVFPAPYYADASFDGTSDLIVSSYNNAVSGAPDVSSNHRGIWRYENTGTENQPNFNFIEENFLQGDMIDYGASATPRLVDLNGDGLLDLIVAIADRFDSPGFAASQFIHYENTGTLSKPEFTLIDTNFANMRSSNLGKELVPAFGDLDDDGDQDMIVGTISGYFHEFENIGTPLQPNFTLKNLVLTNTDVGANASPYLFDADQDGDLDLFVGNQKGRIYQFENSSKLSAQFSLRTDFFGAVTARQNILNGNAKPAFFRDSLGTSLFLGSTNSGVLQYDDIDTVAALPTDVSGTFGNNSSTSNNFEESPFGISKRSGRNQFLIRGSELKQAGFIYGFIDRIGFNITDRGGATLTNGMTVKIKNTSKTSLNDFESNFPSPYPLEDFSYTFGNGWNNIGLPNPFLWDGQSNIVIEVCFRGNFPAQDVQVAMTNTTFNSHALGDITGYNNLSANGCAMPFKTSIQKRPDVQLRITPAANQVPKVQNPRLFTGFRTSPDFADLNNDGFTDAIVGNMSGGLSFFYGRVYDVGIEEGIANTKLSFDLYPNPANQELVIEQDLSQGLRFDDLSMYSVAGQKVFSKELTDQHQRIDVGQLPAGMYLVILRGNNIRESAKVMIRH